MSVPNLDALERLSGSDLEAALGLAPRVDIPAAARRSMKQVGILAENEGGLPAGAMTNQNASLVKASLSGNNGRLVSRWGHILLRRALASRLDAPSGMNPSDFTALRVALLVKMGEGEAARALAQDVDTGNYTPDLTTAALDAYVATADFTGICPAVGIQGGARKDPQWEVARAICSSFQGNGNAGMTQLDHALSRQTMPRIDVLLAQKYAGAAGKARRAVKIEWDKVSDMTPWRYALTLAVGLQPPAGLMARAPARYDYMAATAPMVGLSQRAAAADRAAAAGIVSSQAMVDLYSQIYASNEAAKDWSARAGQLRNAYVAGDAKARLAAMQQLWDGVSGPDQRYSRQVLTAYAAARMPVSSSMSSNAADLVASMLTAGLDQNALRWASQADTGSQAWALLALAAPVRSSPVEIGALNSFYSGDKSEDARKSAFLMAGLAGLGRITPETAKSFAEKLEVDMNRRTRWTNMIDKAAEVNNAGLVALLAGLGMQGESWQKMTPLYLYHIVAALQQSGLEAEARMIAAEAVARG